ncbi:MAG: hypothetical protein R2867_14940 [Caldilineaceae bacterium]
MKFAKWAFWIAGALGLLETVPLYFTEARGRGSAAGPHPSGILLWLCRRYVGLAARLLVIGSDPQRYRPLIPVAIVEKATFVVAAFWLLSQGRLPSQILIGALLDLIYGIGFVVAYFTTRQQQQSSRN